MSNTSFVYSLCVFTSNDTMVEEVLLDWLDFLSPAPSEVLIVVGYDDELPEFWQPLLDSGKVSRLIPFRLHNKHPRDVCIEALLTLFDESQHEWIVTTNFDTLPYRKGNDGWLEDMYKTVVSDENLIGATGSFRSMFNEPYSDKYFQTKSFSVNFSLIQKTLWQSIVDKYLDLVAIENPNINKLDLLSKNRFIVEHSVESYLFVSGKRFLLKDENKNFSIFHTNIWNEELRPVRERYLSRDNVKRYLNKAKPIDRAPWHIPKHRHYYGYPVPHFFERIRLFLRNCKYYLINWF